jgi:hypothetical protein
MKESQMLKSTVGCSFPTTPVGPDGKCNTVLPIIVAIIPHTTILSSLSLSQICLSCLYLRESDREG